MPALSKDYSILDSLKKKTNEKLRGVIFFSSVSDGVGSAALPSLTSKFKNQGVDSLSIAIMPSKIQPADAHFNAYSALQMCLATEGSTVLLLSRDQLENYEGVDRKGVPLKGNEVVNYLLSVFLDKELLVPEIAELSRTFNVKLFSALAVTAASYKIYGSLENMLNAALLKPLSSLDLSSASLLYVLLRMPTHLQDKIPRAQIELEITRWFKEKTTLQSIHISEPIYTEDSSDRIDAVLFIGGSDTTQMFSDLDKRVVKLKKQAVDKGFMTENWEFLVTFDEPRPPEPEPVPEPEPAPEPTPPTEAPAPAAEAGQQFPAEVETQPVPEAEATEAPTEPSPEKPMATQAAPAESPQTDVAAEPVEAKKAKPKRTIRIRKTKKAPSATPENKETKAEKPKRTRRPRKAQAEKT
jgi:hypothetical protein